MSRTQRDVINEVIKNTYKSQFGNILAKHKGTNLWDFHGYIDHGAINSGVRCECGRPLRYQFLLIHKVTGRVRSLGTTHIQDELNIPQEIAKAVLKKIQQVNYDLDEILYKISNRWKLNELINSNKTLLPLTYDIFKLLDANLPLLDRHESFLLDEIKNISTVNNSLGELLEIYGNNEFNDMSYEMRYILSINNKERNTYFNKRYFAAISFILRENEKISLEDVCKILIEYYQAPKDIHDGEYLIYYPIYKYIIQHNDFYIVKGNNNLFSVMKNRNNTNLGFKANIPTPSPKDDQLKLLQNYVGTKVLLEERTVDNLDVEFTEFSEVRINSSYMLVCNQQILEDFPIPRSSSLYNPNSGVRGCIISCKHIYSRKYEILIAFGAMEYSKLKEKCINGVTRLEK